MEKMRLLTKRSASFSLLELLVVIAILIAILLIAFPSFNFLEEAILKQELDILYSTFCFTQKKALASNKEQTIIFDTTNNSYSYKSLSNTDNSYKLPKEVSFGFLQGSMGPPSNPKNLIKSAITFEKKGHKFEAKFFANQAISPGSIYLINLKKSKMVALTVPISQISLIRKYFFKNKSWHES